jgi:hypothetical protein
VVNWQEQGMLITNCSGTTVVVTNVETREEMEIPHRDEASITTPRHSGNLIAEGILDGQFMKFSIRWQNGHATVLPAR